MPTNAPDLTHLHANVTDMVRAAIAFGAGQKVQYRKPSTGEWVVVYPKFNPNHSYRPAADADADA